MHIAHVFMRRRVSFTKTKEVKTFSIVSSRFVKAALVDRIDCVYSYDIFTFATFVILWQVPLSLSLTGRKAVQLADGMNSKTLNNSATFSSPALFFRYFFFLFRLHICLNTFIYFIFVKYGPRTRYRKIVERTCIIMDSSRNACVLQLNSNIGLAVPFLLSFH